MTRPAATEPSVRAGLESGVRIHPRRAAKRRRLRLLLIFLSTLLILDALVGERGLVQMIRAREEHGNFTNALAAIERENARLRSRIRQLQSDPRTIEDIARRELGLVRPGEILFTIKDIPRGER